MTQSTEAETTAPPSRRTVGLVTIGALAAAVLVMFAGVLPAEFGRDPTGLGKLTGTDRLWAPAELKISATTRPGDVPVSRSYPMAFRSDVIDIALKPSVANSDGGEELEYKVAMPKGASYVYSWEVTGIADPEEFYSEFHGHTVADGKAMTVAEYRKATGTSDHGMLVAPFTGVHGWYFQNQSEKPVTIRVKLSGFYALIPDGQPGNEAGLHARTIAF